jgi:hypothetical protein
MRSRCTRTATFSASAAHGATSAISVAATYIVKVMRKPRRIRRTLHVDPRAARNRRDQHVECATADDERCAIEGNRRSDFRSGQVSRQHRGGERDEGHIEKYEAVRELYRVACYTDQPYDVVMGNPRHEDDEEAERKREVVWPERQQTGQQTSFGPRVLQADFEDEQRNRNGKHAIAERLKAGGAFCQMRGPCAAWKTSVQDGCEHRYGTGR